MGGDQQVGALISRRENRRADFGTRLTRYRTTPMSKLLRLATVWNIPVVATNVSTADFIIQSPHFNDAVDILIPGQGKHLAERLKKRYAGGCCTARALGLPRHRHIQLFKRPRARARDYLY